jgi:SAM-dependent methyltransferase
VSTVQPYGPDLAYTHDVGYGAFARDAAPELLRRLRAAGLDGGLVVDLGCGSGIWARRLLDEGFDVLGVDISAGMLAIARERAPEARFVEGSLLDVELPACAAVTAISEPFNYAFDPNVERESLAALMRRVRAALRPGGLLMFDAIGPGHQPEPERVWREGEDWLVCAEVAEQPAQHTLTRRIVTFRRVAEDRTWRRSDELHTARLYEPDEVLEDLRAAGFSQVEADGGWGELRFRPGHTAFAARR